MIEKFWGALEILDGVEQCGVLATDSFWKLPCFGGDSLYDNVDILSWTIDQMGSN